MNGVDAAKRVADKGPPARGKRPFGSPGHDERPVQAHVRTGLKRPCMRPPRAVPPRAGPVRAWRVATFPCRETWGRSNDRSDPCESVEPAILPPPDTMAAESAGGRARGRVGRVPIGPMCPRVGSWPPPGRAVALFPRDGNLAAGVAGGRDGGAEGAAGAARTAGRRDPPRTRARAPRTERRVRPQDCGACEWCGRRGRPAVGTYHPVRAFASGPGWGYPRDSLEAQSCPRGGTRGTRSFHDAGRRTRRDPDRRPRARPG